MKRTAWRLGLGMLATALALIALVFVVREPTVSANELDQLGPGYEVLEVSDLECGNGQQYICDRAFSVRHEGSRDDLRQALAEIGITQEKYGDPLRASGSSDPGRSDVVLSFVSSDPGSGELLAFAFLAVLFLGMAVWMGAILTVSAIRRLKPSLTRSVR